jgi:hypothetical protein
MNPLGWIKDAPTVAYGDEYPLPEELDGLPAIGLADGRGRLGWAGGTAYGLRRSVDQALIAILGGWGALRYGETLLRVGRDRTARVVDRGSWWHLVASQVVALGVDEGAKLLDRLYNADNVKLRGLAPLAEQAGVEEGALKDTMIEWKDGRKPWKVYTPRREDWPVGAEQLADGESYVTHTRKIGPGDEDERAVQSEQADE